FEGEWYRRVRYGADGPEGPVEVCRAAAVDGCGCLEPFEPGERDCGAGSGAGGSGGCAGGAAVGAGCGGAGQRAACRGASGGCCGGGGWPGGGCTYCEVADCGDVLRCAVAGRGPVCEGGRSRVDGAGAVHRRGDEADE